MSEPGPPSPTPPAGEPPAQPANPYAQPSPYAQPAYPPTPQPTAYQQLPPYRPGPEYLWFAEPSAQQPRSTSGFAVAALVFGLIGGIPLAIAFGAIALGQTGPRGPKSGRGMAIAGLVAAGVWVVGMVAVGVYVTVTEPERNDAGQITEEGSLSTYDVEVGDCLNGILETENETIVRSLPAVPCSQPHEGEVFATIELENGEYPGEEAIFAEADQQCSDALVAYSPSAYDDPTIGLSYLYPREPGWPRDRELVCIAYSLDGTLTGTIAERQRT